MKDRARYIDTFVIFIFALAIYLVTCCRTVYVGDSGELATVLTTGGIAHPPGYPLYTILGYLWVHLLFFLRPIVAANIFSAVFAAGAVAVLLLLLNRLRSSGLFPTINKALALAFAFSYPVWSQAVTTEVYTLGALLYIVTMLTVVIYFQKPSRKQALLMAFMCGLVLTHHFSGGVILVSVALALLFTRNRKTKTSFATMGLLAVVFMLPLTLYLFLLLRFSPELPINWLSGQSLGALWDLISGTVYQQYVGATTFADFGLLMIRLGQDLFWFGGPLLLLLGVPGILWAVRNETRLYTLVALPALLNIVFISSYHIPDFTGYLIPTIVAVIIGLQYLCKIIRIEKWGFKAIPSYALALLLFILPLFYNYQFCNISKITMAEQYGRDLLDATPNGKTLVTRSDNAAHATLYLRYIEDYRPDVTVYSTRSTFNRMRHDFGINDYAAILDSLDVTPGTCWAREYVINQGRLPSKAAKFARGLTYTNQGGFANEEVDRRISQHIADFKKTYIPGRDYKLDQVYLEYMLERIDMLWQTGQDDMVTATIALRKIGRYISDPRTCLAVAQFFKVRGMDNASQRWIALAARESQPTYIERETYVLLGTIYRRQNEPEDALKAFTTALDISPDYEPARYNFFLVKSQLKINDGDFNYAADLYDSLLTMEPDNWLLLYNKAQICEKLPGRLEEAYTCYQALVNNPGRIPEDVLSSAKIKIQELDGMVLGPK